MSAATGIQVEIQKRLGDFRLDVAFSGAAEGVTTLFGPSGAGKSQVLAAIAGAARPDNGRIVLNGETLFDSGRGIDLPMQHRAIGWVFQDARLFPHMDVTANLSYGARRATGRPAIADFDEVVAVLGIGHLLKRRPRDLSGGERQRVAIGRALLGRPRLLLMDEPLSALDAPRRAEIMPYLEQLKTRFRLPILYVTHALSELARLADRVVVLETGRVAAQGPTNEVLSRTDLPTLAGRHDAATAFDAEVVGHDESRRLTNLKAGESVLRVPALPLEAGAKVRVAVLAREVLLASGPPSGLSARNILPGRIEHVELGQDAALVRVRLHEGPDLLSAVTEDAVLELDLKPGRDIWAVLKSVAVEHGRSTSLLNALDGA
ncbi:MAG: molybdenum ABC transporter ATP-binding protein [Caulobacteraceae bacterium]